MRPIQPVGPYKDVVEAPSAEDPSRVVKLGIRSDTFQRYASRGMNSAIAQYYGIVQDDLILARHAFRGLNRPLMLGEDMTADESVLVYTWRSLVDYEWFGSRHDGRPERIVPPPAGRVFVVLIREELHAEDGIVGSIERWNWIREDPKLPGAPIDSGQRYGKRLWSRAI